MPRQKGRVVPLWPLHSLPHVDAGVRPFVGRQADVVRFQRAVRDGVRLIVVEGEAGIGKSRLIDEATSQLDDESVVLRGSADRDDGKPLGALAGALEQALSSWEVLPDALRRYRDVIDVLCRREDQRSVDRDISYAEFLDGVVAVLRHTFARRSGLVVLEDVHSSEADCVAAIERIVRGGLRCTVVMSVRTDHSSGEMVADLLGDAERHTRVERIALGPLSVADVQQLLRAAIGIGATNSAGDLHDRTGGHPLLLHQLLDTGAIGSTPDVAQLPSSVGEWVRRRIVQLDAASRSVLHAAVVAGPTCGFDTLSAVAQLDESALMAALQRLCDERLLVERRPDEFSFVHALTREVVEAGMLSRDRRALHRRTLDALGDEAPAAVVLTHAVEAGDRPRTLLAARDGAAAALSTGRVGVARRMAAAGLEVAPDDVELLTVHALASWQLRDVDTATVSAHRVIELVGDGDRRRAAACGRLLARVAWEVNDEPGFRAAVEGLLRQLDLAEDSERVYVLDAVAEVTMLASDDRAVAWAEESLAAFEASGTAPTAALVNLGAALTDVPGRREEGRRLLRRAAEATEVGGDSFVRARALNNLLCEAVFSAPMDVALGLLDRFEEAVFLGCLGAQLGENVALYRAVLAERVGDAAAVQRALAWPGPTTRSRHGCLAAAAVSFALEQGRHDAARAMLSSTLAEAEGPLGRSPAVWFAAVQARVEVATRAVASPFDASMVVDRLFAPFMVANRYMLDHLDQLGRACLALARAVPDVAPDILRRFVSWSSDDPDAGSIALHLMAVVAEQGGEFVAAGEAYRGCLDGLPLRAAAVTADALMGLARCADELGDRVEARRWAATAVAELRAWPGPAMDESVRLLRRLGGRPPRSATPALLTDRERDVAVQVSMGLTNIEIGRVLNVSPRTVGVHVRHILAKLGAANRAEIAAYAVRERLAS